MDTDYYDRSALADALCDAVAGVGLSTATSGLFLAAPRRTGKTTFLRRSLLPAARGRACVPVYIDLWEDVSRTPSELVATAIGAAIDHHQRLGAQALAARSGVPATSLRLDDLGAGNVGKPDGKTLVHALRTLSDLVQKPIFLVVDEAQHVLNSSDKLMFALKSARDELNTGSGGLKLFIVCTGSHRDKLLHLVLDKSAPFYGARIQSFPLLDKGYTDWYTAKVNRHLASNNQFDTDDMLRAFELVGHRPEALREIVSDIGLEQGTARDLGKLLDREARLVKQSLWSDFEATFHALTAVQRAVLTLLIQKRQHFSPFSDATLQAYRAIAGIDMRKTTVQAALAELRSKNLIWRSARGEYALDDQAFAEWFEHTREKMAQF